MIEPEAIRETTSQTSRLVLLRNNLLVSALIFAVLECWRHCFFLTDDNLDGALPFFIEMGRHLLSGQSPFHSDYLFGGNYNFLRDPAAFNWSPIYLVVSLLAGTPFHFWIVDADAFVFLMLATAGFVNLAWYLRREYALTLGDGWIMFYTMSFVYSMIALTTGASWLSFLGNHSALPWLTLGILQRSWRRGIGLVALFSLHQLLGGHLSPTVSNSIFLSFFAFGASIVRRSILPLGGWLAGYAIALVVISPLLVPMLEGFFASGRSHGVTLDDMGANNVPVLMFPTSVFFGMALWTVNAYQHPYSTYTVAMGACAAAWCFIPAVVGRTRWRGLEVVSVVLLIFGAVLICRPLWLSQVMMQLPLFKSMRWPFREFLQFQFFLHLFLVLRPLGIAARLRRIIAWFGATILLFPLFLYDLPPTLNSMDWDRELLFNGGFDRYWAEVRPLFKPGDRIAVLIPMDLYMDNRFEIPYTLLSTYNYSELTHVVNTWGYSPVAPSDQFSTRTVAIYPFGAFTPEQKASLMAEGPDFKYITLESREPLKITLSTRNGPTVDLTPYVPARTGSL